MSSYERTKVRSLTIAGFRSIKRVVLEDLPDVVVLLGPNGSGKSNLLRALRLLLRAVSSVDELPADRDEAVKWSVAEAFQVCGIAPDDFHRGSNREIRVSADIQLGTIARARFGPNATAELTALRLGAVFQDLGDGRIIFWCDRSDLNEQIPLAASKRPEERATRQSIRLLTDNKRNILATLESQRAALATNPAARSAYLPAIANLETSLRNLDKQIDDAQRTLGQSGLLADRVRFVVCKELLQLHGAYRRPGGEDGAEAELNRALLSEDARDLEATDALAEHLRRAGLFGSHSAIRFRPVESDGHRRVHFERPPHGWLPLRNLGTGEQQVILLLARNVVTRRPIAHVEEPEAHLHWKLMRPLADFLAEIVRTSGAIDQLWVATHHHMFTIAPQYFDVSLDASGGTQAIRRPRSEASSHFYEPGPFWDALRELVTEGVPRDAIISRNEDGSPVTAGEILDSLNGDARLAREFALAATRSAILSLKKSAK